MPGCDWRDISSRSENPRRLSFVSRPAHQPGDVTNKGLATRKGTFLWRCVAAGVFNDPSVTVDRTVAVYRQWRDFWTARGKLLYTWHWSATNSYRNEKFSAVELNRLLKLRRWLSSGMFRRPWWRRSKLVWNVDQFLQPTWCKILEDSHIHICGH
jgi:hypothetical protein